MSQQIIQPSTGVGGHVFTNTNVILGTTTDTTAREIDCTPEARNLLDDLTKADMRNTLELGTANSPAFAGLTLNTYALSLNNKLTIPAASGVDCFLLWDFSAGDWVNGIFGSGLSVAGNTLTSTGAPGGSPTEFQWNNAGVLDGIGSYVAATNLATLPQLIIGDITDLTQAFIFQVWGGGSGGGAPDNGYAEITANFTNAAFLCALLHSDTPNGWGVWLRSGQNQALKIFDESKTPFAVFTEDMEVDFGAAVSFEIPNGTGGTTDATGEIYLDTNGDGGTNFSGAVVQIYTGAASQYLFPMALPLAASEDNFIPVYDASSKTIDWEAQSGAGETIQTDDTSGGSPYAVDFASGRVMVLTLDHTVTPLQITLSDLGTKAQVCYLKLVQDSTGGIQPTWGGTNIKFQGSTAPTISVSASAEDIVIFLWDGTDFNEITATFALG